MQKKRLAKLLIVAITALIMRNQVCFVESCHRILRGAAMTVQYTNVTQMEERKLITDVQNRNPEESGDHLEGDIILPIQTRSAGLAALYAGSGLVQSSYRWPNATIVYIIDKPEEWSSNDLYVVLEAMREISEETCFQFQQLPPPTSSSRRMRTRPAIHHVRIIRSPKDSGCSAVVGYNPSVGVEQKVNLEVDACFHHGIVLHELIHAIGFYHEQSRTDRDKFVTVFLDNVRPESRYNFDKYEKSYVSDFGFPYDYFSIMHYPENAFAQNPTKKTIIPKKKKKVAATSSFTTTVKMGQRNVMSFIDRSKIRAMYGLKFPCSCNGFRCSDGKCVSYHQNDCGPHQCGDLLYLRHCQLHHSPMEKVKRHFEKWRRIQLINEQMDEAVMLESSHRRVEALKRVG